jgi:hypothetical protein
MPAPLKPIRPNPQDLERQELRAEGLRWPQVLARSRYPVWQQQQGMADSKVLLCGSPALSPGQPVAKTELSGTKRGRQAEARKWTTSGAATLTTGTIEVGWDNDGKAQINERQRTDPPGLLLIPLFPRDSAGEPGDHGASPISMPKKTAHLLRRRSSRHW